MLTQREEERQRAQVQQNGQRTNPQGAGREKNKQAGPGQEKPEGVEIKDLGGRKQEGRKMKHLSESRIDRGQEREGGRIS